MLLATRVEVIMTGQSDTELTDLEGNRRLVMQHLDEFINHATSGFRFAPHRHVDKTTMADITVDEALGAMEDLVEDHA
jgi:hypothetical protein